LLPLLALRAGVQHGQGGDQTRLAEAYLGTAVEAELRKLLARGGVIGGTSAGAAIMSRLMIAGGNPKPKLGQGLGLIPNVIIDQHFTERKRAPRLRDALASNPGWAGIGIDEATALVVRGRTIRVVGAGTATVCLAKSALRPERKDVLKAGAEIDLIALSRAALDRAGPAFPPAKMRPPVVAKGTLVIGGGGGLSDEIYQRFIDAAGGPDGLFIVIPTANPDPVPAEPYDVKRLKKLGVARVQVLHTRDRAKAGAPETLAVLREARGVWFGGGRQWRFVDSYAGAHFEKELHALLARGGAIGGSSAGASIQAEYLCRGDPRGNLNIIAEGYERGFGFLPGTAIDQHFFKRKRTRDMSELVKTFPQLLGIGIDEGTAAIVHGAILEVAGKSNIAIYDRSREPSGEQDYELLTPGTRFNLRTRKTEQRDSAPCSGI
jgi:cyanophycinase